MITFYIRKPYSWTTDAQTREEELARTSQLVCGPTEKAPPNQGWGQLAVSIRFSPGNASWELQGEETCGKSRS